MNEENEIKPAEGTPSEKENSSQATTENLADQPQNQNSTKTGLEPHLAGALAYSLSFVTGIVFLLIEPEDKFIRFHAMQSIATGIAYMILSVILSWVPIFGGLFSMVFALIGFGLWIVLIYRAYNKEEWEFPVIGKFVREQM